MALRAAVAAAVLSAGVAAAPAAAVTLDPDFGDDGAAAVPLPEGLADMTDLALAPDGGFYAAVAATAGRTDAALLRLTADGRLDVSFGNGGLVRFSAGVPFVHVTADAGNRPLAIQPALFGPTRLFRFTPSGAPDASFGSGGSVTPPLRTDRAITLRDGGILILGSPALGDPRTFVARLREDGTLDPSFGTGGLASLPAAPGLPPDPPGSAFDMEVDADGRILVGRRHPAGTSVARLLSDGGPDPSFATAGAATLPRNAEDLSVAADSSIVYGVVTPQNQMAVGRLTPSGAPDPAGGPDGVREIGFGPTTDFFTEVFALRGGRAALLSLNLLVVVDRSNRPVEGFRTRAQALIPGRAAANIGTAVIDAEGALVLNRKPEPVHVVRVLLDPDAGPGQVRLTAAQLLINQRISQAAIRRVNAVLAAIDGRSAPVDTPTGAPGAVTLSARQLQINQRIAQAAVYRANLVTAMLNGRLQPVSPPRRDPSARLTLSATQLLINQRISQAAVRRVNLLPERIPDLPPAPFPPGAAPVAITATALGAYRIRIDAVQRGRAVAGSELALVLPAALREDPPRPGQLVSGEGVIANGIFFPSILSVADTP